MRRDYTQECENVGVLLNNLKFSLTMMIAVQNARCAPIFHSLGEHFDALCYRLSDWALRRKISRQVRPQKEANYGRDKS